MTEFWPAEENIRPALEIALESLASETLRSIVAEGFCAVQAWDNRIDCCITLSDKRVVGEMVPLVNLTSAAIREAGQRLKARQRDANFELRNELRPPLLIRPREQN